MLRHRSWFLPQAGHCRSITFAVLVFGMAATQASAGTYTVLHRFAEYGGKGDFPLAGLVRDSSGYMFGITDNSTGSATQAGAIFRLGPRSDVKLVLPGQYVSNLLFDDRSLYAAGVVSTQNGYKSGIIRVSKDGTASATLHVFPGGGGRAGELYDSEGNLVVGPGRVIYGASYADDSEDQVLLFALRLDGSYKSFRLFPSGTSIFSLAADRFKTVILGTTSQSYQNCAIANAAMFRYSPSAAIETIFTFPNGSACGRYYVSGTDAAGNIYGYTNYSQSQTLFELVKSDDGYRFIQLYKFSPGSDPYLSMTVAADGSIVGTTSTGNIIPAGESTGTLFRFAEGGLTILHDFTEPHDGLYSFGKYNSGPVVAPDGAIFDTTAYGGIVHCTYENRHLVEGCGVVYSYRP